MMGAFDQSGAPQQGQQPLRPPMPQGHVQPGASVGMQTTHAMNPNAYAHRGNTGMPSQPYIPPSQAQRNGSFTAGSMHPNGTHFSSHPPLHQNAAPMHPMNQMHHPQMGRQHSNMQAMPMPGHDMRNAGPMHRQPQGQPQQYMNQQPSHPPPQQQQQSMNGSWQSERDTPHRRDMIHHM